MSRAVRFVARWDLRRRAVRVLLVALVVAFAGGGVLAAVAGARRSGSALERFQSSSRSADVEVAAAPTRHQITELRRLPGVAAVGALVAYGLVLPEAPDVQGIGVPDTAFGTAVDRGHLVAGRTPDPAAVDEITIGEGLANRLHLRVGDRLRAESFTPDQIASTLAGVPDVGPRAGPVLHLRVVGIVRRPLDLGEPGASGGLLVLTPAFGREYEGRIGVFGSRIRIRADDGPADVPEVVAGARRVLGQSLFIAQGLAVASQSASNAIDVITQALWIAAAVLTLAGLVAVAIVLSREIGTLDGVVDRLRDLGCTRAQRVAIAAAPAVVAGCAGALLAVPLALVLSPLFPIGVARRADPNVGFHADWVVIAVGLPALALIVGAIGAVAALRVTRSDRAARTRFRTSSVAERAAGAGLPPSFVNGIRLALSRGRDRSAVPVGAAVSGAVLGIVAFTVVLVYTSSLDQLAETPARYGAAFDFTVEDVTPNSPCGASDFGLSSRRGVDAVTEVCVQSVTVAGRPTTGIAYRRLTGPAIHPAIVSGRAPRTAREVALGQSTLDELHGRVGDRITIRGRDRALTYRVVGRAAFPTLGPAQPLADGVAFTSAGYAPLFDQNLFNRFFVGRIAPGADRARLRATIDAVPQLSPLAPAPLPGEIDRLRQIDWLPITLAALIAGFAALALAHTLLTAIRRRRSELAVLKTLGFRPGQIRATIASQATTFAVLGAVVGLPVGVLSGALVWRAVADGLGVATATTVPLLGLVAIAAAAVAVANVVALWPARRAARMRPAPALAAD